MGHGGIESFFACKLDDPLGYNKDYPTTTTTTTTTRAMNATLITPIPPSTVGACILPLIVLGVMSRRRHDRAARRAADDALQAAIKRERAALDEAAEAQKARALRAKAKERAAATAVWVKEHRARAAEVARLLRERQSARTRASERHAAAASLANDLIKARATIKELEWRLAKSARARMSWDPLDHEFGVASTPRKRLAAIEAAQRLLLRRRSALEEVKRQFRAVDNGVRAAPRRSARLKAKAGPRRSARLAAKGR